MHGVGWGALGMKSSPGNRWTKREASNDPLDTIYGAGHNTLYLRAFLEDEYNEMFYNRLLDPQNRGNPNRWIWVRTTPLVDKVLAVQRKEKAPEYIKETGYLVKQLPGARLGYEILSYIPDKYPDQKASFKGFKVDFSEGNGTGHQTIWLEDKEGRPIPKSFRKMSMVKETGIKWFYLISALPLLVGLLIFVCRRKVTA